MKENKGKPFFLMVLAVFCALGFWGAGKENSGFSPADLGAFFWPRLLLALLFLLLLADVVYDWRMNKKGTEDGLTKPAQGKLLIGRQVAGMLLTAGFVFLMPVTGFIPACLLFLSLYGYLLGERRILLLVVWALSATILIFVVFQESFGMALPRGMGPFSCLLPF